MQLSLNQLTMSYPGGKRALNDLALTLESPNLIGLVGPNGAGKTTLMKLLVGALLPSQGSITLNGKPLSTQETELKAKLGYLPQLFGLYDELTVYEFLDYMSALKGLSKPKEMIYELLGAVNLSDKAKKRIRTLSGGQRQRVGIAQALLGNPELLIFDEPTVGLDPEERIHFRNLFSSLSKDRIVLLSTHIIEDVQSVCSRIIVLHRGGILFDGPPEGLVAQAEGHVGEFYERDCAASGEGGQITARHNTAQGVVCRLVSDTLPHYCTPVQATLEDAYMYLLSRAEGGGAR